VRGPAQQVVLDSVVQEIDVKTGLVLYQWDSLDHVPLTDTYQPLPPSAGAPFDYFHINSLDVDRHGNILSPILSIHIPSWSRRHAEYPAIH